MKDVALLVALAIDGNATIATSAVTTHALQHQTLIRRYHTRRNVVHQFLILNERITQSINQSKDAKGKLKELLTLWYQSSRVTGGRAEARQSK